MRRSTEKKDWYINQALQNMQRDNNNNDDNNDQHSTVSANSCRSEQEDNNNNNNNNNNTNNNNNDTTNSGWSSFQNGLVNTQQHDNLDKFKQMILLDTG